MPRFFYKARDKSGKVFKSFLEAERREDVLGFLDTQGLIPIQIALKSAFSFDFLVDKFTSISKAELVLFSTQLATMLKAGLPITRSLKAITTQVKNKKFKAALVDIEELIEKGRTFYNALSQYPQYFDEVYIASVQIGEISGNMPEILNKLAEHIDKDLTLKQKIKNATLYPKLVFGAIIAAVIILITFVIPRFAAIYKGFKTELPLPTKMLIAGSDIFARYWPLFLAAAVLTYGLYLFLKLTPRGRKIYDPAVLKLPIIGDIVLKMIMVRFARFFSLLFSSGVVITNILDLLLKVMGNVVFEEKLKQVKADILVGRSLGQAVGDTGFFTPLVLEMINVGEETGSLDEMLKKVSDFYENELDYTIKNLTTLLEPVMLVGIFGMVLFLALSVFLPMWDMVKFARG